MHNQECILVVFEASGIIFRYNIIGINYKLASVHNLHFLRAIFWFFQSSSFSEVVKDTFVSYSIIREPSYKQKEKLVRGIPLIIRDHIIMYVPKVTISHNVTPKAHTSASKDRRDSSSDKASGAIHLIGKRPVSLLTYTLEPPLDLSVGLRLKSEILICICLSKNMFLQATSP